MSFFSACSLALIKIYLANVTFAGVGDTTGLVGSTGAGSCYMATATSSPGIGGTQATNESAFGGYLRVAISRATGSWDFTGTNPSQGANHSAVTFPACTSGSETEGFFSIGVGSSGATQGGWLGGLSATLGMSAGITQSFAAGAAILTLA